MDKNLTLINTGNKNISIILIKECICIVEGSNILYKEIKIRFIKLLNNYFNDTSNI